MADRDAVVPARLAAAACEPSRPVSWASTACKMLDIRMTAAFTLSVSHHRSAASSAVAGLPRGWPPDWRCSVLGGAQAAAGLGFGDRR